MRVRLGDLWRWDGTVDRGPYVILGVGLALIKYNLDRFLTLHLTGKPLWPQNYWVPGDLFGVMSWSPERARVYLPLALVSLPFIWTGVVLTMRRLRAVQLPVLLVMLFFVPILNLLMFLILSVLPSRPSGTAEARKARLTPILDRVIPEDPVGSAAFSFVLTVPAAALMTLLSATFLGSYGWGLFIGLPFFIGLTSVVIYGYHRPRSLASCVLVATIAIVLLAGVLIALAVEGLICILMAAPIAGALAIFGAFVGWLIQRRPQSGADGSRVTLGLLALMPALLGAEYARPPEPPVIEVCTAVEIDAPPERVWLHVVSFAEIPAPDDWLFRSGIAYPMRAVIHGRGVGAERHCVFSTGPFVEPIEVWDEPRQLKFSVTAQPPAMRELTLYPGMRPPHVDDYLRSRGGQFLLVRLPSGRTRLEGATWYTHKIWPVVYWRLWSDWVIHRIHRRVLEHVKREAERS